MSTGTDAAVHGDVSARETGQRLVVLGVVRRHRAADVETLVDSVGRQCGAVCAQGVPDVLGALDTAGLVRRIEQHGAPVRYAPRDGGGRHHLVCRGCGLIVDVGCAGDAPCLRTSSPQGFAVDDSEVVYRGYCADCRP